jgi:uncharacterized protein
MRDHVQAIVDSLYIYPIKSCAGVRVSHLHFTVNGLIEGDREWVVVNSDSEVVWQGSHPQLALVKPNMSLGAFYLTAPGRKRVEVPQLPLGVTCEVRIWNDMTKMNEVYEGIDAGDLASTFLQDVTGSDLRLVRLSANALERDSVNRVHVVSTSSLAELNSALSSRGLRSVDTTRFRPNIVVSNVETPFLEEAFTELRWTDGDRDGILATVGPCIRCVVPNVDPTSGTVCDEPLQTVAALSAERHPGNPTYFGIYATAKQHAVLHERAALEVDLNF